MNFAESFEELAIWQRARIQANQVYEILRKCRDFDFRSQMHRASISVMNNVAEGFERRTKKDFAHFLDLAKGSAGEVRSMLYLGEDRGYFSSKVAEPMRAENRDLCRSIGALAASLRR